MLNISKPCPLNHFILNMISNRTIAHKYSFSSRWILFSDATLFLKPSRWSKKSMGSYTGKTVSLSCPSPAFSIFSKSPFWTPLCTRSSSFATLAHQKIHETPQHHQDDSHHHHEEESINEPEGYPFGVKPGEKPKKDIFQKIFIYMYLGGIAVFCFLYTYKPESSPKTWARQEAIKRMKGRGVDLSDIGL